MTIQKIRRLRMVLAICCNSCHHAIADTVADDASRIYIDSRVWGCTLFVYFVSDDSAQSRQAREYV